MVVTEGYPARQSESRDCRDIELDNVLSPTTLGLVDTLAKRVQWILDHRRDPHGDRWEAKALGGAAKLKSPAHVGMIARGEISNPRSDTLRKIAEAAGVRFAWLANGDGAPDLDAPVDDAPPARAAHVGLGHPAATTPLLKALNDSYLSLAHDDPGAWELLDLDVARDALVAGYRLLPEGTDLHELARSVLVEARRRRRRGEDTSPSAISWGLAAGKAGPAERQLAADTEARTAEVRQLANDAGVRPDAAEKFRTSLKNLRPKVRTEDDG